jgi:pimeloyl-ACP methyl ester carboxylesterase
MELNPVFIDSPFGYKLRYHYQQAQENLYAPCVVFLHGYRSDLEGTKSVYLNRWCLEKGLSFLSVEYSGHGQSGGSFDEGSIKTWCDDALFTIQSVIKAPLILVGSSMGGWLMIHIAQALGQKVIGLVGVAAAPDFTVNLIHWRKETRHQIIKEEGPYMVFYHENGEESSRFTKNFIEEGNKNTVLDKNISLACPMILLHGTDDTVAPFECSIQALKHVDVPYGEVCLIKGGDHVLRREQDLIRLSESIEKIIRFNKRLSA